MTESICLSTADGTVTIRRDQPMSLHTTFRIGGHAEFLARVSTTEHILSALDWADRNGMGVTAIGGGSNLLVSDRGIRGLVLLVRATGKQVTTAYEVDDLGDHVRLRVPAQAPISWLGHLAASHGWDGLEWAAGLPGVVGGAVVNNAGAHGSEITDRLVRVELLDLDARRTVCWSRDDLEPVYRRTVLKAAPRPRDHIVLQATFVLPRGDANELTARATGHAKWRRQAQPTGACAGSVFTNPPDTYAGYLIEHAGLKGRQVGGVTISELHGNFLVNTGGATAADVRAIIAIIQDEVERQFGIRLVPEIEQIGEP